MGRLKCEGLGRHSSAFFQQGHGINISLPTQCQAVSDMGKQGTGGGGGARRPGIRAAIVVVQSPSPVWLFVTPWTAALQASLSFTISWSLLKLRSIESVMPSNHLILYCLLLLLSSVFPSIRVFSNESALHSRWPKYWSFSFSISPSDEYSGLISFQIDWFDLLAVQETLLQHHSLKASILWHLSPIREEETEA